MNESSDFRSEAAQVGDPSATSTLKRLAALLRRHGWQIGPLSVVPRQLPALAAFPVASALSGAFQSCESADGSIAYYGHEDYADDGPEGWRFLEDELLRHCDDEAPEQTAQVDDFVSAYCPIAINLSGDYAFLLTDQRGQIFESYAPDLEALSLIATSLPAFVEQLELHEVASTDSLLFRTWVRDHCS